VDPFRPWPTPYVVHKWAVIVGLALWAIGIIAGKLGIIAAGGVAFIAAGVAAMVARRSLMTGVTIGFLSFEWTKEELAEMAPRGRLTHALVTGGVLVLLGVASLVFLGTSLRDDWQRARRAELAQARGAGTRKPDIKKLR
jgi:uncharacterized membrane protein